MVRKSDLLKELSLLQGIVERKNTIPILANVLLDAAKNQVALLATDLDVGLRSHCEATVTKAGTLTLPAKKLFEIVSALPETEIRIEEDAILRNKALYLGSKRYPGLQILTPTKPPDAAVCPVCGGTGKRPEPLTGLMCRCGGMGWAPPNTPLE